MIEGALIFGNGKPYPGVLLFRSSASRNLDDGEYINKCRPVIERLNAESQSHARIKDDMLIPIPHHNDGQPLEKSSKGTVLRNFAEKKYQNVIEKAYRGKEEEVVDVKDEYVIALLSDAVRGILKREDIKHHEELFHAGLDSMTSMQIRQQLVKVLRYLSFQGGYLLILIFIQLLPKESKILPLTVVEDCGTING